MPRNRAIEKRAVLRAAAEVVRKEELLSVRAVAEELGCSTQPVYSVFGSMEELRKALYEEAKAEYGAYIGEYLARAGRSRYESFGMGFVKFAHEERGLFRFLFMGETAGPDPYLDDIIAEMMALYQMDEARARAFHGDMTLFSYGLAILVCQGNYPFEEGEIAKAFRREFYALYAYYFPERPRLG